MSIVGAGHHRVASRLTPPFRLGADTFTTYFFPVGGEVRQIFDAWVTYLRQEKLWGNEDPLFPATLVELGGSRQFEAVGLARRHWSTASPIRTIFQGAFEAAGLPYFNPHSFRNTLVQLGQTLCRDAEQFKAWSQNMGHDGVLTTFLSYGAVSHARQGEIIRRLASARPAGQDEVDAITEAVRRTMLDLRARSAGSTDCPIAAPRQPGREALPSVSGNAT